jgi:hypothetical protein
MNKQVVIGVAIGLVAGFVLGKTTSLYELTVVSKTGSRTAYKINTITGTTWMAPAYDSGWTRIEQ